MKKSNEGETGDGKPSTVLKCFMIALGVSLGIVFIAGCLPYVFNTTGNAWEAFASSWTRLYFDNVQHWTYRYYGYAFVCLTFCIYFACRKSEKGMIASIFLSIACLPIMMKVYNSGFRTIVQTTEYISREDPYLVFITTPLYYEDQYELNKMYWSSYGLESAVVWNEEDWMKGEGFREKVEEDHTLSLKVDRPTCEKYALGMDIKNTIRFSGKLTNLNIWAPPPAEEEKGDVFYKLTINGKPFEKLAQCSSGTNELMWKYVGSKGVSGAYPDFPYLTEKHPS